MSKDEARLALFRELREAGFVKMFEELSKHFLAGIVATARPPINKEMLEEQLSEEDSGILEESTKATILKWIQSGDRFRYHKIQIEDMMIHYFYVTNGTMAGRNEFNPDASGLSYIITDPTIPKVKESEDEEGRIQKPTRLFAAILVGEEHPAVTDRTRGLIVKHEFAHVIFQYIVTLTSPGLLEKYKEELTDEEIWEFREFLCDFVQFDQATINKYTPNPVVTFVDTMPLVFHEDAIEKYNPLIKSIASFFNTTQEETES